MESGKEVAEKMKQDGEKALKSLLTKGTLDRGTLAKKLIRKFLWELKEKLNCRHLL